MSDRPHRADGVRRRAILAGAVGTVLLGACDEKAPKPTRTAVTSKRMPTLYIPHGAGPCFFMDWTMGPADTWDKTGAYLRGIGASLPEAPRALLVVSAHWEAGAPTVTTATTPSLYYDYSGFPPHTYALSWPAPGAPEVAAQVRSLLERAGLPSSADGERGLDHGVFIPLKLGFPEAEVPTVQLSLQRGLDPATHVAIGRALAPLRDEGVFIIGSGMSYHNMRGFGRSGSMDHARRFDAWLKETVEASSAERDARLTAWQSAPSARETHPREEHLLPLMVVAGAAGDDRGTRDFNDDVMGVTVSAHRFG